MVVMASIMQVYWEQPSNCSGLFLAIGILAIVFLWLELRRIIASVKQYSRYVFRNV